MINNTGQRVPNLYYWHKVKHILKFIKQSYFIASEQKSILTLPSYALIHKVLILYICLMHNLSKNCQGLDGLRRQFQLLPFTLRTIISKFQ